MPVQVAGTAEAGLDNAKALGIRAWDNYESCKDTPQLFNGLGGEAFSLHVVLKEAHKTLFAHPLSSDRQAALAAVLTGCKAVLADQEILIERYEILNTQGRYAWDKEVVEVRARATSHVGMLTALVSTSQFIVESKLEKFIEEVRSQRRNSSIRSLQTRDSMSAEDQGTWRQIRKELESIGVTVAAFDANRDFIFKWFSNVSQSGIFEETHQKRGRKHGLDTDQDCSEIDVETNRQLKKSRAVDHRFQKTSKSLKRIDQMRQKVRRWTDYYDPSRPFSSEREQAFLLAIEEDEDAKAAGLLVNNAFDVVTVRSALCQIYTKKFVRPGGRSDKYVEPKKGTTLSTEDRLVRDLLLKLPHLDDITDIQMKLVPRYDSKDNLRDKLVLTATEQGWIRALVKLNPDTHTRERYNLLHIAARKGYIRIACFLIKKGADMNSVTDDGNTPLIVAIRNANYEVVQDLMDNGANVVLPLKSSRTAWYQVAPARKAAVEKASCDALNLLLKNGARSPGISTLRNALDEFESLSIPMMGSSSDLPVFRKIIAIVATMLPKKSGKLPDRTIIEEKIRRIIKKTSWQELEEF